MNDNKPTIWVEMTIPPFMFDIKLWWVFPLPILTEYSVFLKDSSFKDSLSSVVRGLIKEIFLKMKISLKYVMEKDLGHYYVKPEECDCHFDSSLGFIVIP